VISGSYRSRPRSVKRLKRQVPFGTPDGYQRR